MNRQLLEQLIAFEQYGTLAEVAEHLLITQPTVTRGMRKLEEESPTLTGSKITGTFLVFAVFVAFSYMSVLSMVPMFSTKADEIFAMSSNSSSFAVIIGEAPIAKVTLAQSFTVT